MPAQLLANDQYAAQRQDARSIEQGLIDNRAWRPYQVRIWHYRIMNGSHLFAIGRILKTQGFKGKVKVFPYGENPHIFREQSQLYLQKQGRCTVLQVQAVQIQKRSVLLKFLGRDSAEAVQDLLGETIFVNRTDLPKLDQDEYYWFQLIGMELVTETGQRLGILKEILPTGSNDVYVVVEGKREILIPAIREVIREVDLNTHTMVIRPIEGLLKE
jgi:16S rRNA processing protein RimM